MGRRRTLGSFGMVAALALAGAAGSCDSADEQLAMPGGGTGGSGATGSGSGAQGGGMVLSCDPPCDPPQFCSVLGVCIDPGTCLDDGDCDPGLECDEGVCVPGGGCGSEEVAVDPVAPNLLIVLDRSCSMRTKVNGVRKWTMAVEAIGAMTTEFAGQIRFGLILFPDKVQPKCQQDEITIAVAPDNEADIQSLLEASLDPQDLYYPDGPCVTNIDTAMEQAATQEPALDDTDRSSYVLLITDGKQAGCSAAGGDSGTTAIIEELCQDREVSTFVLGFGGGVDPNQLNIFAEAGCVPTGDPDEAYYRAEDQPSLEAALETIANATIGCVLQLEDEPEDPDAIYVFFNDEPTPIPRDPNHENGWDYDEDTNQITFYGAACEALQDGTVTDVDVIFGCAEPVPD